MTKVKMRHPRSGKTMEASDSAYRRVYRKQDWELLADSETIAGASIEEPGPGPVERLEVALDNAPTGTDSGTIRAIAAELHGATRDELAAHAVELYQEHTSALTPPPADPDPDPEPAPDPDSKPAAGGQKGRSSRAKKGSGQ